MPFSKILIEEIPPTLMASFLYLGAGVGIGIIYLWHYKKENPADRLTKKDLPYTVGMILLDIIAPIFLMLGLKVGTSSNAALLGNFEIVATSLIALLIFKEKITSRLWTAIILITLSSIILSSKEGIFDFSIGSIFVLLATVCWGLENNCTKNISSKSTYEIVTIKGIFFGEKFPDFINIFSAFVLGFVAYGLSIFTYIRAQRTLGAAKTSAYYATAPFIGAMLSFLLLNETFTVNYFAELVIMIIGTYFIVYDTLALSHEHIHQHIFDTSTRRRSSFSCDKPFSFAQSFF